MKWFFAYFVPCACAAAILIVWAASNPRVLEITADVGSATAAKWLGDHYNRYENKEVYDPEEALHWFKRAADLGNVDALFEIGELHLLASVEGFNYKTAHDYVRRAAENGHLDATHLMGTLLELGIGTDQDLHAAEKWYLKSIEQGSPAAEMDLAKLYFLHPKEFGSDKSSDSFEKLLSHASQGEPGAAYALGYAFLEGSVVPKDVERGLTMFTRLIDTYPALTYLALGEIYFRGRAGEPDYKKAFENISKASEFESAIADHHLGIFHQHGLGVAQSYSKAAQYYSKAIEDRFFDALTNLGILYRDGTGVEHDYNEAIRLFKRAEELEIRGGSANFGWMQLHGMGMPEDVSKGLALIKTAADEEDAYGAFYLAKLLEAGKVIPQDRERALELYRISEENGFYPAKLAVKRLEKADKACVSSAKEKAERRCPAFSYQ